MSLRPFIRAIALVAILLGAIISAAADPVVPPAMTGQWNGQARIIVIWCNQTNLTLQLHIASDGQVTGKVGDATLLNGKLRHNRRWLGRQLNLKTDFIITGDLQGPIVAAENISRRSISIPLNFKNGTFTGGLHTSGTHVGTKKRMVLSADQLTLSRTNPQK